MIRAVTASFWHQLAALAVRHRIRLIRQAQKRPYSHIGDYMYRYWLIPRDWKLPFCVRIHHIARPDADPYLHSHPFDWRTIVLSGWYVEEDAAGRTHIRRAGSTRHATADTLHRITKVSPGGTWTLFVMWNPRHDAEGRPDWGFMAGEPPRLIPFHQYQSPNDRGDLTETTQST